MISSMFGSAAGFGAVMVAIGASGLFGMGVPPPSDADASGESSTEPSM
jgi:hypothetical protein